MRAAQGILMLVLLVNVPVVLGQKLNPWAEQYIKRKEQERQEQLERAKLDLERKRLEAQTAIEKERLDLERQRLAKESTASITPEDTRQLSFEINTALLRLSLRYPDFRDYLPEMTRLTAIFSPASSPDSTIEKYLEGLYVISKYASFSAKSQPLRSREVLTLDDVLAMTKAGVGAEAIVQKVKTSLPGYRLSVADMISLRHQGVPDAVIQAMVQASPYKPSKLHPSLGRKRRRIVKAGESGTKPLYLDKVNPNFPSNPYALSDLTVSRASQCP